MATTTLAIATMMLSDRLGELGARCLISMRASRTRALSCTTQTRQMGLDRQSGLAGGVHRICQQRLYNTSQAALCYSASLGDPAPACMDRRKRGTADGACVPDDQTHVRQLDAHQHKQAEQARRKPDAAHILLPPRVSSRARLCLLADHSRDASFKKLARATPSACPSRGPINTARTRDDQRLQRSAQAQGIQIDRQASCSQQDCKSRGRRPQRRTRLRRWGADAWDGGRGEAKRMSGPSRGIRRSSRLWEQDTGTQCAEAVGLQLRDARSDLVTCARRINE